jgi:hypothetical protein
MESACCAICGLRVSGKELHLDHCHETGQTRGYLCGNCNLGLGLFRDNQKLLEKAAKYLDWYEILHSDQTPHANRMAVA